MLIKGILLKLKHNPFCFFEYINKARLMFTYQPEKIIPKYQRLETLDADQTVDEILKGKSIIRVGDGEMEIIRGFSIISNDFTQKYDKHLAEELKKVLVQDNSKLLTCISHTFLKEDLIIKNNWVWKYSQRLYYKYLNFNVIYGDALIFRSYNKKRYDKLINYIKNKQILMITHNASTLIEKHKYLKGAIYYDIPANNASLKRNKIIKEVEQIIEKEKPELVLVSGGAFAKELINTLFIPGSPQFLDIGSFYDYGQKQ